MKFKCINYAQNDIKPTIRSLLIEQADKKVIKEKL